MLQIYNSLTRKKEPFTPIVSGEVRMYVCGMTVYDYCHLGHARVMVVFDMVVRYLRERGYRVTYVRNITDIDDKIIKRANENKEEFGALTARFIEAMHEDERALGVLPPDQEPRATQYMAQMLAMIGALEKKSFAYRAANADVYYRVRKFAPYGALSGKSVDDLRVGARVEVGEEKEDPLDFVLWKAAKPGEPQWASPWGLGRPGWHIECSAMSTHSLGNHFDIHGGGRDLQFPHHENEIAQSEATTGEPFVNTWMHVGFVRVNEEKMSKSLGNFFTVREVLKQVRDPEVIRYFILASHYRSPLDYSDVSLVQAENALTRLYISLKDLPADSKGSGGDYEARFHAAMDDDFNTAAATSVLFDLAHDINRLRETEPDEAAKCAATLRRLGGILGLLQRDPEAFLKGRGVVVTYKATVELRTSSAGQITFSDEQIDALIAQRTAARKAKNWAESDRIRDELKRQGVVLEDSPAGTTWRRQ
jgi:cysteinyl-tRNA synthetase